MKKIVILGGGESGVGAAILAKKQGFEVFLSDKGNLKKEYQNILQNYDINFEEGIHTEEKVLEADLIIKSPGVPKKSEIIKKIVAQEIPIVSEIEFASRYTDAKIIAITGSNGKTTTTSLIYHILTQAGLDVGIGGNIGKSFAQLVAEEKHQYYVLELSSFQLDDIQSFKPYIAIVLNITPDHLDQYDYKFDLYAKSKFRITENQSKEDYFVYNFDDDKIKELLKEFNTQSKKIPFSMTIKNEGANADDKNLHINYPDEIEIPISELSLIGKHNISNSLAAATTANILRIRKDVIRRSLSDFRAVEHRLESVIKVGGIEFVNDSKATNINAVYFALESMTNPVIWIVGGTDKGNNYKELLPLVKKKVKAIICLGIDNSTIVKSFEGVIDTIVETNSMKDAVRTAYMLGEKGNTVLLSPACASYDLFENYIDRGNQFKKEVKNL